VTGHQLQAYCGKLIDFIRRRVSRRLIDEHLNTLLLPRQFQGVRKVLLPELLAFLEGEMVR